MTPGAPASAHDPSGSACPLCAHPDTTPFFEEATRAYRHCPVCDFVFVPAPFHLSETEEKARYDFHRNHPGDPGYRRFLSALFIPLSARLAPRARGLDFGCGSGPTLSVLFAEAGFEMDLYDKYYAPHPEVFERRYDFITATEVVEHLREPGRELARLFRLLRPGGWLGLMTRPRPAPADFPAWHYRNDPTHIAFYSQAAMHWIARHHHAALPLHDGDVTLFRADPSCASNE